MNQISSPEQNRPLMAPFQRQIDFAVLPKDPTISLELTNHCNLKCPCCATVTLTARGGKPDPALPIIEALSRRDSSHSGVRDALLKVNTQLNIAA